MRAAAVNEFGEPAVLHIMEFPDPQPGPGEVLVRVRGAGVQPFDTAVRRGEMPGMPITFPQILGNEFAGEIVAVGAGVEGFAAGDGVIGWQPLACYAELVAVPATQVVRKPAAMPWDVAGGFSACAQTAWISLEALGVGPGDVVLIHAAAGGVGTVAVQLARLWGARMVIGTASEANHEYLRSLGAIPVTYGAGLAERIRTIAPDGVDAALDAAGGDALEASVAVVHDRRRAGTIVDDDAAAALGALAIRGQRSQERLAKLVETWEQGHLQILVRRTFALEEAAEAHRESEARHGRGKLVITPWAASPR